MPNGWVDPEDLQDILSYWKGGFITHCKAHHAGYIPDTLRDAYGLQWGEACDHCFEAADILAHIKRFPEGQFVALRRGAAFGFCTSIRTSRPPSAPVLPWREAIGDLQLSAHEPNGDWLYGVEMAVRPDYQRGGIGSAFYEIRFALAKKLNLRGIYTIGMLMGYRRYTSELANEMHVVEYGNRVIAGEITDPTVSMQMKRGFRADYVVENYVDEPAASDAGVLLVWQNPDYQERA